VLVDVFRGRQQAADPETRRTQPSTLAAFDDSVVPEGAALLAELAARRLGVASRQRAPKVSRSPSDQQHRPEYSTKRLRVPKSRPALRAVETRGTQNSDAQTQTRVGLRGGQRPHCPPTDR